jgi:hypothetical protein
MTENKYNPFTGKGELVVGDTPYKKLKLFLEEKDVTNELDRLLDQEKEVA